MHTLFNEKDNQEIVKRIQQLNNPSIALWGKMTVAQMIVHCEKSLDVVEGKLILKRTIMGFLFGKMIKKKILNSAEMKKNMPTDKNFIITISPDFDIEIAKLIKQIERFKTIGESIIVNKTHPFFGELTTQEWGNLSHKHLDHHLKQFGV